MQSPALPTAEIIELSRYRPLKSAPLWTVPDPAAVAPMVCWVPVWVMWTMPDLSWLAWSRAG